MKTGISGVDEMLGGGITEENIVVISGPPGVGKTVFSMQFLLNGCALFDEAGLYVSFEDEAALKRSFRGFRFELEKNLEDERISTLKLDASEKNVDEIVSKIRDAARKNSVKRIVLDSATLLKKLIIKNESEDAKTRRLLNGLRDTGCTAFIVLSLIHISEPTRPY